MIRKIALELVLLGLLLYSFVSIRAVLTDYDPLADAAGSVATVNRTAGDLPAYDYRATEGRDIFEKNLFHPSRAGVTAPPPVVREEPVPEVIEEPVPPPEPMPQISLKGILEDPSGERVALISLNNERSKPYRVGDMFNNFEVVEIGILEANLTWKGEPVDLKLRGQAVPEKAEPDIQPRVRQRR